MSESTSSTTGEESLEELLNQAKRAAEIIDAVDFDKVKSHDAEEVAKLEGVTSALDKLSAGESVERVDGLDEVADLDPTHAIKNQMLLLLDEAGYGDRLGRVFGQGLSGRNGSKPAEVVPHRAGLPSHDLVLAPNYAPTDGAHGIFVSATGIFSAHVPEPVTRHHWKILRSQPYDDDEELVSIVGRYLDAAD